MKNGKPERILVVSPNWLGDAVMAMPAFRRLAEENPQAEISVLSRPALAPLWRAVEGVASAIPLPKAESATFAAGRMLRAVRFDEALLLPNSFRSAVAPFLARIPRRRGTAFHARRFLVNDPVRFGAAEAGLHQAYEDAKILCGSAECDLSRTGFVPGAPDAAAAALLPPGDGPLVGIVPGAARGPSKRWPRFAEAAALVAAARPDVRFAVFGGKGEEETCAAVAAATGAPDLCGKTGLAAFAALLASCDAVMCNDSGGMHLAAAAGTAVVAVFGITDPAKTGPIGPRAVVVRAEGVRASRAVKRDDPAAVAALLSIPASRVAGAVLDALRRPEGSGRVRREAPAVVPSGAAPRDWTLRNVRVLDPASGSDSVRDLFCRDGVIADSPAPGAREIDASGLVAMPAAIDLHVHFREPGGGGSETVASGLAAAARGGFGTVVAMPNTVPPLDTPGALEEQRRLAAAAPEKRVKLLLSACCTEGRAGLRPAPLEALAAAGAAAFSDDGAMVEDDAVMRETLVRARKLGLTVMDHAVRAGIARGGVVRDCAFARAAGWPVFPDGAETAAVERDVALAEETGARLHLQHLSAEASPAIVAAAVARGVPVTAEATPHHLLFAAEDIPGDDASWKMNPPLGTRAGREALRRAVADGTVSCFATDHAPHSSAAKARGFAAAPFGCIGLETALAATWLAMVSETGMAPIDWAARWTLGPAAVVGLAPPSLAPGEPARVTVLRPGDWTPSPRDLASLSRNCPFLGARLPIRVEALLA